MSTPWFDATEVEPSTPFETLPKGKYLALIIDQEELTTRAETGRYLKLTEEIIDGEFKGRLVWDRLNLTNPNPKAEQIARAKLSSLCRAIGVLRPSSPEELLNIPHIIDVGVEERNDKPGEYSNVIKVYLPATSSTVTTPPASAQPVKPVQANAPWNKRTA